MSFIANFIQNFKASVAEYLSAALGGLSPDAASGFGKLLDLIGKDGGIFH